MSRRRSSTILNRITGQQDQHDRMYNSVILEQPQTIKVTFRRINKRARLVEIPAIITGQKLLSLIEKQFYIPEDKQILFWKGRKIQLSPEISTQLFSFHEKQVIHVHNKDIVERETISLHLFLLNTELIKYRQLKLSTSSSQIISNVLERYLMYQIEDIKKFIYIQSGKYINIQHSFTMEAIEDDSIIIAVPNQNQTPLSKLQQREIQILQSRMKLLKKPSLELPIEDTSRPDFKKKPKCNVYRSMFLPQTKQLVWKQDTTCDISLTGLPKRLNNKQIHKISQISQTNEQDQKNQFGTEESNDNLFLSCNSPTQNKIEKTLHLSIHQNDKNSEQHRLAFSQDLKIPYNIVKLKPPKIAKDTFEEIEELDFGQGSTSHNYSSLKDTLHHDQPKNKPIGALLPITTLDEKIICHDD